jgi:hypothetical protein
MDARRRQAMAAKKSRHLKYGEGQREQFGEGMAYRPEEKTEAAQESKESGFAGGEREEKPLPESKKPADESR